MKKESVQFYLPAVVKEKLKRLAAERHMSITKYLIYIIGRQK